MENIHHKINAMLGNEDHYLVRARKSGSPYFLEFLGAAEIMGRLLSERDFERWLHDKMQFRDKPFDEKSFIQLAVEASVVRYFGERYPKGFGTDVKLNDGSGMDVDCQFLDGGFSYNVEVKCPDYGLREEIRKLGGFQLRTIGRADNKERTFEEVRAVINSAGPFKVQALNQQNIVKNLDNTLKDFLISAQEKFGVRDYQDEMNILVVGCDDVYSMEHFYHCLYANKGLFTDGSFSKPEGYDNVDAVVFSNLYFKHRRVFEKKVLGSWSLESTFNVIFPNPWRRLSKLFAMVNFLEKFDHFSFHLAAYDGPKNLPSHIASTMRMSQFVKDLLERKNGRYFFELPAGESPISH